MSEIRVEAVDRDYKDGLLRVRYIRKTDVSVDIGMAEDYAKVVNS